MQKNGLDGSLPMRALNDSGKHNERTLQDAPNQNMTPDRIVPNSYMHK